MEAWQTAWRHGNKNPERCIGECEAKHTAKQCENKILKQQFRGDAQRRSTERRADGQFLLASLGTNQEQVGYIRSRDQQNKANAAHQNPQELAHVAHHMLLQSP